MNGVSHHAFFGAPILFFNKAGGVLITTSLELRTNQYELVSDPGCVQKQAQKLQVQ